jgi:hypothetical protein
MQPGDESVPFGTKRPLEWPRKRQEKNVNRDRNKKVSASEFEPLMTPDQPWFNVSQAAAYMGNASRWHVLNVCREQKIPFILLG